MEKQPLAWQYRIEPYADHAPAEGVVCDQAELSPAIPDDRIIWTPIHESEELIERINRHFRS